MASKIGSTLCVCILFVVVGWWSPRLFYDRELRDALPTSSSLAHASESLMPLEGSIVLSGGTSDFQGVASTVLQGEYPQGSLEEALEKFKDRARANGSEVEVEVQTKTRVSARYSLNESHIRFLATLREKGGVSYILATSKGEFSSQSEEGHQSFKLPQPFSRQFFIAMDTGAPGWMALFHHPEDSETSIQELGTFMESQGWRVKDAPQTLPHKGAYMMYVDPQGAECLVGIDPQNDGTAISILYRKHPEVEMSPNSL